MRNGHQTSRSAAFHKEFNEQVAVFERKLPSLLKKHRGKYAAIFRGKLVGIGADESRLFQEVNRRCKGRGKLILIQQIQSEPVYELA